MRAAYATRPDADQPLDAIEVGERPEPEETPGRVRVRVAAASLNRHELWTLRGVGIEPEQFPVTIGCDGAGTLPDGSEVVIYPVISLSTTGDETLDPGRTLLTELEQGTCAEYVAVPARNAVPRPRSLTAVQAAPLGTSYLTAYRMLFTRSGLRPSDTMLVQGATGGVSTALVQLGVAAGFGCG